nr:protein BatD [Bacteroidales bacterium]
KFYDEILKGIWGYLSDKLSIPLSELSRNNSISVLEAAGVDPSVTSDLLFILDTCEFARYAPAQSESAAADIYEKASSFIRKVENIIA